MKTKGVASVRSPVCNLQQQKPAISHEDFVHAVVREFQDHYNVRDTVTETLFPYLSYLDHRRVPFKVAWVDEGSDCEGIEEIRKGMHELTVNGHLLFIRERCG